MTSAQAHQRVREYRNKMAGRPIDGLLKLFNIAMYNSPEERAQYVASQKYATECRHVYEQYEPVRLTVILLTLLSLTHDPPSL